MELALDLGIEISNNETDAFSLYPTSSYSQRTFCSEAHSNLEAMGSVLQGW